MRINILHIASLQMYGIGCGSTAVVQAASCITNKEKVAIKRIDLDQYTGSIEELQVNCMTFDCVV